MSFPRPIKRPVEEEEFPEGDELELEPIDIEGDPEARAIAIDPIDVEGDPNTITLDPIDIEGDPGGSWLDALRIEGAPPKDQAIDIGGEILGIPWAGAAARGVAQGATFGFADELAGAGEALLGGDYAETRDRLRSEVDQSQREHPIAYGAGTLAGAGATIPLLGGMAAGESVGGRIAAAVGEGAGMGALGAAGASEASPLDQGFREDIAAGALTGGALGGTFGALAEGARAAVPWARQMAARQRTSQVAGADLTADLARMGRTQEEAAASLEGAGIFRGLLPRTQGALRGRVGAMGEAATQSLDDAMRTLDDVAEQMEGGVADVSRAARRATQATRRAPEEEAALKPWLDELGRHAQEEVGNIGRRLANLAGSGRAGLNERQALRAARTGEPVSFGTLEAFRRRMADALLERPSRALQRLHDDIAESLLAAAEARGIGPQYFEAMQAQQLAALVAARGQSRGLGETVRNAVLGGAAQGGLSLARALGQGAAAAGDIGVPGLGTVAGALTAQPGVRHQGLRAGAAALEGAARALPTAAQVAANPAAQAVAGTPDDDIDAIDALDPPPESPLDDIDAIDAMDLED